MNEISQLRSLRLFECFQIRLTFLNSGGDVQPNWTQGVDRGRARRRRFNLRSLACQTAKRGQIAGRLGNKIQRATKICEVTKESSFVNDSSGAGIDSQNLFKTQRFS